MDGGAPGGGGGSSGGGGPAPFLLKTYDMVDDASTDDIVSWSSTDASFVVWNPTDFTARLLPTYFKHNNFSSFIRQLNTYGFRKIDPERWEFANEDFVKGKKHLLKNIHRRKPVHSHSHPPGGGLADERAVLEEEIERLNREKAGLEANLGMFKQQQTAAEIQIEDLERRMAGMEQRQLKMVAFVQRAMQNPQLMENLLKMASASSIDISVIHKKRRLPPYVDYCQETSMKNFCDDHGSTTKPENGYVLDRDFCDKLKLELCFPDNNLVTVGTQSSNEDNGSSQAKQTNCGQELMECLPLIPETLQLCGTEAPTCPTKNALVVKAFDEEDGLFPCHLSLTLASFAMQIDSSEYSGRTPDLVDQGAANTTDLRTANATDLNTSNTARDNDLRIPVGTKGSTNGDSADAEALSLQEVLPTSNETPAVPTGANDIFWQQFLTERPGSSDAEDGSCCFRVNPYDEQNEESTPGNDNAWQSKKDMEQLKL